MTRVGRPTWATVHAMVAVFPLPVMPSRVWNRSPSVIPRLSAVMALGWSPAGRSGDTTSNAVTRRWYRTAVSAPPARSPAGRTPAGRRLDLGPVAQLRPHLVHL